MSSSGRVFLVVAVSIVIALIVLSSAITLLPTPPGSPTPTPPYSSHTRPSDRHNLTF